MKTNKLLALLFGAFFTLSCLTGCGDKGGENENNGPSIKEEEQHEEDKCSLVFKGTHCSMNNYPSYEKDSMVNATILPDRDYALPDSIEVDGATNYSYSKSTGEVKFIITQDTTIKCDAIKMYSFTFNGTNCSMEHDDYYSYNTEFHSKIICDSNALLPSSVSYTGLSNFSYDASTGDISGVITGNVIITCACTLPEEVKLNVTFSGTNCTATGTGTYNSGTSVTLTIIPNATYVLPDTITVTGADNYSYNKETGQVLFVVLKNVNVTAVCEHVPCSVMTDLKHCSIVGSIPSCSYDQVVDITLLADEGYMLPPTVTVTNALQVAYVLEDDSMSALLTIKVQGEVVIGVEAIYIPKYYDVSFNLEHCSIDAKDSYIEQSTIQLTVVPDEKYMLPQSITVSGLDNWNYDNSTGFITGKVVAAVEITVSCVIDPQYVYTLTFTGINCSANNENTYIDGETASFVITPASGYKLPDTIGVTGNDSYIYDSGTGFVEMTMTGDVIVSAIGVEIITEVTFTFNGTHCSTKAPNSYEKGNIINLTIIPDEDYELPDTYTSIGLENITYNKNTGEFSAKITANATLSVEAKAIDRDCTFTFQGTNCSAEHDDTYTYGTNVTITIVPDSGYGLPSYVTVIGNDDYSYSKETGMLTLKIKDNVVVTAIAPVIRKVVTFSLIAKYVSMAHESTYRTGDNFVATLVPDDHFFLPDHIFTKGLDEMSYDNQTGLITGTVSGNIEIEAVGMCDYDYYIPVRPITYNCNIPDLPELLVKGQTITVTVVPNPNCVISSAHGTKCNVIANTSTNELTISTTYQDRIEALVWVDASFIPRTLTSSTTNCTLVSESTHRTNDMFMGQIVPNEGYRTPDNVVVSGLSDVIYNKTAGVITGYVIGDIHVVAEAPQGQTGSDRNKITQEQLNAFNTYETFSNVSSRGYSNGDNQGLYYAEAKIANNSELFLTYDAGFTYTQNFYHTFSFENGEITPLYNYFIVEDEISRRECRMDELQIIGLKQNLLSFDLQTAVYDEIRGCYKADMYMFDSEPFASTEYYFVDGKLESVFVHVFSTSDNIYSNFYNYGTTEIDYKIPDEFYKATVKNINGIDLDDEYGKGSTIRVILGYKPLYVRTTGLSNVTYSYLTGEFTATVESDFTITGY